MYVCLFVLKLLLGKLMDICVSYITGSRIFQEPKLSIFQIQILTCACAVEFCGFLEKYSKYRSGLSGFERKLLIAYLIELRFSTSLSMGSQNWARTDDTFSQLLGKLL